MNVALALLGSLSALQAATPFAPINHKTLPPEKSDFYFVALGDNRPAGAGLPVTTVFKGILNEVSIVNPSFVLSSGDLIYGNEESLDMYRKECAEMKPLLEALPCPFFNAPGNHEVNNRAEFLDEYQKQFGNLYGSFEYGGLRFVALLTSELNAEGSITGSQLGWLKSVMATKKPTVLFHHHPIFKRPKNSETEGAYGVTNGAELHELYKAGGAVAVMEGHDHVYNAQVHDGIAYTIAGGAGAPLDAPVTDGGFFHYVLCHVHEGKIEQFPIPAGSIQTQVVSDGVGAIANYSDFDFPISNFWVSSKFKPSSAAGMIQKKKGQQAVEVKIEETVADGDGYKSRVSLGLVKHRAIYVKLSQ